VWPPYSQYLVERHYDLRRDFRYAQDSIQPGDWSFSTEKYTSKLGNGKDIPFWQASWLGSVSFKELFPQLFEETSSQMDSVSDMVHWQIAEINGFGLPSADPVNGFSVKSCYKELSRSSVSADPNSSMQVAMNLLFALIE
ncbi:hypothetical protein L195_g019415, partial [Trifolium pratense]